MSAGMSCSLPTGRRHLPFTASFLAGAKRTPNPVRRTRISCSPPEGRRLGACSLSVPIEPVPFWLYYFNVGDVDAAAERVKTGGGQIFEGPFNCWTAAGSSDARTLRAPSLRCRESGAKWLSGEPLPRKSAGPPSGAGFHREAGWITKPAVRGELRKPDVRSACLDQSLGAGAGLGSGLSCRFDQEM